MSAADIESALAQDDGGGSHDETGSCEHGGVMVVEDDVTSTSLQTTVILTDPTTHIVAPEHQTRSKHNKKEPPIECVWYSCLYNHNIRYTRNVTILA